MAYTGLDYFHIEELLSEEERMIRAAARGFVEERVLPLIVKHHREATFPVSLVKEMGEMGFLGANLTGYGCPGLGDVAYGLIMQELERGDSGVRSCASVQGALVMYPIHTFGSEEQKERWLPALTAGEKIGCFGLTEPDFGSDPAGMVTKAVKGWDGYILNGSKMWITNGTLADVAVVWAKLDGEVHGFLVEKGTPGFTARKIEGKFSLRASDTAELSFEECVVPAENILPKTEGLKSALACLTAARYGIAWGAVGAAMACYEAALTHAKSRIQFGKPIASFQLVQEKLVFMLTEITKAQLLCLRLGRLKEEGKMRHTHSSLAKRNNVAAAREIARTARELLGASGIVDEYPVIRHMLNLESIYTYEGTHDIHTLILGEDITGIRSFV